MVPSRRPTRSTEEKTSSTPGTPVNSVLASTVSAAAGKAVQRWMRSRGPSFPRLFRGAAAGAGAAGLVWAGGRLLGTAAEDAEFMDELLAGAGKGLVYAAILDPLLPGPPLVRGALMGTADYLAAPWGGLLSHLQSLSPARKLPLVGTLLETGDAEDDPYLAFLLYGVALAILHGDGGGREE